jgi:hypothetical protein
MKEPWSLQEVRRLRELAQAGMPLESIAAELGRTSAAVRNKAGFHAIPVRRAQAPVPSEQRGDN